MKTTVREPEHAPEGLALMDGIARQWEGEFESLERTSRYVCYPEKLKSFLQRLHESAHRFEPQSDGSRLIIFWDGTVYGEESDFDRLLERVRWKARLIPRLKAGLRNRTLQLRRRGHK